MSKYTVSAEIKNIILHSTEDGVKKKNIIEAVMVLTGWGKTKARETVDKVLQIEDSEQYFIDGGKPLKMAAIEKVEAPECKIDKATSAVILGVAKDHSVIDEVQEGLVYGQTCQETLDTIKSYSKVPKDSPLYIPLGEDIGRIDVEDCGTHSFNHATKQYIWQLKDGSTLVIGAGMWKAILREYKGGSTIPQIALKHYQLPSKLTEVMKKEGITHDSFPATSQDLKTKDVEVMTTEEAKFEFAQKLEKESWKATQNDANKWREFEYGTLEPFKEFLSSWNAPSYTPKPFTYKDTSDDETFVIGLSDLHFGSFTSAATTFSGKSYSTKQAVEAVDNYLKAIAEKISKYKNIPSKVVVMLMGDILHTHSNNGMTTKGTQLKYDVTGPEQLNAAVTSLTRFLEGTLHLFKNVEVHSVRGNHSGNMDYALGSVLQAYYHTEKRLTFNNYTADHAFVRIGSGTLAILTHGASDEVKAILPSSDAARQNWALNLFAQWDGNLSKIRQKLLFSADQHHIEVCEYASFTHYMFPTAVKGDHYAESKGLNNRAAQLCLVVGAEGVTNHIPIYL